MADYKDNPTINCLHGTPRKNQFGEWYCDNYMENTPIKIRSTGGGFPLAALKRSPFGGGTTVVNQGATSGEIDSILGKYFNAPAVTSTGAIMTSNNATGFDLSAFIAENKILIAGVGLVAAYFLFFSGGLGATDRTVTSTTRFGRKS